MVTDTNMTMKLPYLHENGRYSPWKNDFLLNDLLSTTHHRATSAELVVYNINKEICSCYQYMIRNLNQIIIVVHFWIDNRGLNKWSEV